MRRNKVPDSEEMPMAIEDQIKQAELPETIRQTPNDAQRLIKTDVLVEQGEHHGGAHLEDVVPGSPLYARYQSDNPSRPVNWRYQHGQALAAANSPPPHESDDPHTAAVAGYLRAIGRCGDDRACVDRDYPGLGDACRLAAAESEVRGRCRPASSPAKTMPASPPAAT
jgi:hypothetical protein